jgi:lysine-ketoglutarate reductase/saccharopine dehydrogenase-like protein (TIGR00300 family)
MPDRVYEDVRITGHLIDSDIASQVMDAIVGLDGEFETLEFVVGRTNEDPSRAVLRVLGRDHEHLEEVLRAILPLGAESLEQHDARLEKAPADGVLPEGFYSSTNLETAVRVDGRWVRVADPEMDCGVCVDASAFKAWTLPLARVRAGDTFVVGRDGVRVRPVERRRDVQDFEFMSSEVSSEKPKELVVHAVAQILRDLRETEGRAVWVVGPAVVHTGAANDLARLVEGGYVDVLLGGNAVAVHDIEAALYGTSLGVSLHEGVAAIGGHEHHIRAINAIRSAGGIGPAVESGLLRSGLMHAVVTKGVPFVLAGSIRDDGPLPEVLTDALEAQESMRVWCQSARACVILSSMLHGIAVGNMLPASVRTVCVDINPAVVTKLADRGSFQTTGIVTDVGLFIRMLADELAD